jgi:hypothetical protein
MTRYIMVGSTKVKFKEVGHERSAAHGFTRNYRLYFLDNPHKALCQQYFSS